MRLNRWCFHEELGKTGLNRIPEDPRRNCAESKMSRLALSSVSARRARLIQLVKRVVHRASALGPRGGLGRERLIRANLAPCAADHAGRFKLNRRF